MSTCFFIGHRNAPETQRPLLDAAVERHIAEYGVNDFVVGHYGRFDYMAAGAVRKAKERHPDVMLTLLFKDIVRLADILGHSSIETTRIYTARSGKEERRQLEQLRLIL